MQVTGGDTNVTTYFMMRLVADGTAATGLTITTFDLQYTRTGVAPVAKADATALGTTDAAHGDNQMIEVDAADSPGLYRVDWPDLAFAAGVRQVHLAVTYDATVYSEALAVDIDAPVNLTTVNEAAQTATLDTIKAETVLIVADTNELQTDDVPGLIATAQLDLDTITGADGVNLLSATQTSIDTIETDTTTDIPALIAALPTLVQIFTTAMTESYANDGVAPNLTQALFIMKQNLEDFVFNGVTKTVRKLDGVATAATYTLDSASSPTSSTRTT